MDKYDGKPLLEELGQISYLGSVRYYDPPEGYFQRFTSIYQRPRGELFLTTDALYIFRKRKKICFNYRKTGIKLNRTEMRGANLTESYLHLQLSPSAQEKYREFFKSHFTIYTKNRYEDSDVNRISFYVKDVQEGEKFVQELKEQRQDKDEIKTRPEELEKWIQKKNERKSALNPVDYKILLLLYKDRCSDWSRTEISKAIKEPSANTRVRIERLHKLGFLDGMKKGEKGIGLLYKLSDFPE